MAIGGKESNMVILVQELGQKDSHQVFIDAPQAEILNELKAALDAGGLREVRDTPEYWQKYTTPELNFILEYLKEVQKCIENL